MKLLSAALGRRALLERLALTAGGLLLPLPFGSCRSGCSRSPKAEVAKTFDPREWAVVEAACSRIIPSDDTDPGAREANVVGFIDRQLAEPHFAVFRREFECQGPAMLIARSSAKVIADPRSLT